MAILFDFNGTMLFDESFQEASWRQFIEGKIGRAVTAAEFQRVIHGRNAEYSLSYFLQRPLSRPEIEALEEEKEAIYRDLCLHSPAFALAPGLETFLDGLQRAGVPANIATASGWNNVRFFFDHLGLGRWFPLEKVVYNDGTYPGKPAPDMYLKAAEKLGVPIGDCYVFEDSASGIEAGRRAKAKGVVQLLSMEGVPALLGVTLAIRDYRGLDPEEFR